MILRKRIKKTSWGFAGWVAGGRRAPWWFVVQVAVAWPTSRRLVTRPAVNAALVWACAATLTVLAANVAVGATAASSTPAAPTPAPPTQAPRLASLETGLRCLTDQGRIPGAVILVQRNGKIIYRSRVGFQDVATRTPMTEDTIFRLYSMSKPITSVAVMMLMEEGKLALDDPLYRFVPEFKDTRVYVSGDVDHLVTEPLQRPITLRDLLTHTSGLTYHFMGDTPVHQYYRKYGVKRDTPVGSLPTDAPAAPTLEELVHRLARAPLLHQPGQRFDYSYSTTVLGLVIERASGVPLDRFLQDRLFGPLGMRHTGFFVEGRALDHFVTNYLWTGTELKPIENRDTSDYRDRHRLLDGGGALASTAGDYLRFAQMLLNGGELDGVRILKPETVARMIQDHLPPSAGGQGLIPGMSFEFGYGFAIGNAATAREGWLPDGAYGWDGSGNTFFWVDPGRKQVTVFMTQVLTPGRPSVPLKKLAYQALYGDLQSSVKVCD
jgi:CubicO group peptidase (beta-lactamase class C family)